MIHHFILTYDSKTKQFNREEGLERDVFALGQVFDDTPAEDGCHDTYTPEELSEYESLQHELAAGILKSYILLENSGGELLQNLKQSIFDWAESQSKDLKED